MQQIYLHYIHPRLVKLIYTALIVLLALMTSAQCQKTADDWLNKGNLLLNLGEFNEAINAYNKAIELNQSNATAWKQKGNALLNLTKYQEALECNNKAIELDPKYASAWNNKGVALVYLGEYDDAIKAWDESIRLDSSNNDAWNNKGYALGRQGKYKEAANAFGEANRLDPKKYDTWNATEYMLDHSPDWMEIESYEQGRGLICYITLNNKAGTMIRSSGNLRIEIYDDDSDTKLWSESYPVDATDFIDTTAGLGLFAHDVTIWHTDRIPYETIRSDLGDLSLEEAVSLEIRAYFETSDGRTLKDKTSEYIG